MYKYQSPIGTFTIHKQNNGRYALRFAQDVLGHYDSAVAATDDIYTHTSGLYDWDILDGQIDDVPTDIHEWTFC